MKLTRTIVLESYPLTRKKFGTIKEVYAEYSRILESLTEYAVESRVRSHLKLRKLFYEKLKEEYDLPTHYYYTVCQDAVTRAKSFLELKKKGKTRTEKPVIKRVSLWLDDTLWDYRRFPQFNALKDGKRILIIGLTTKGGRIKLPLKPHKLFFKYLNEGWKIKPGVKLRVVEKERKVLAYFVFEKEFDELKPTGNFLSVDYNADNVSFGTQEFLIQVRTDLGRMTRFYSGVRKSIQESHLVGWKRKTPSRKCKKLLKKFGGRKMNKRIDLQRKLAKRLVEIAKELNTTIVLEAVPKNFNQRITGKRRKNEKRLRDTLHNISMNGFQRFVFEKAVEYGVSVVFVNPFYSSQVCPHCGAFRVKPDDDALRRRVLKCPICGFKADRDFVAVQNLLGLFPFSPKVNDGRVEDSVSPVMLSLEANLLHHKNSLVIISQGLQQNRCRRKRFVPPWLCKRRNSPRATS
ncbi:RNA-guided endonuclease InsQ/TnpB family protein [Thermococcus alcaliphilus]|uniref:RNA-guided endonuclease InsQ/TnpB family protein n=1 Tax=Thermococcus alcaliphilus TaxID=139207 RepID=UPI002090DA56|nr:transposase [Thermococcus alcaliphilus]MCO6042215.1 transposase [Thermococcus alcaliphilus]